MGRGGCVGRGGGEGARPSERVRAARRGGGGGMGRSRPDPPTTLPALCSTPVSPGKPSQALIPCPGGCQIASGGGQGPPREGGIKGTPASVKVGKERKKKIWPRAWSRAASLRPVRRAQGAPPRPPHPTPMASPLDHHRLGGAPRADGARHWSAPRPRKKGGDDKSRGEKKISPFVWELETDRPRAERPGPPTTPGTSPPPSPMSLPVPLPSLGRRGGGRAGSRCARRGATKSRRS